MTNDVAAVRGAAGDGAAVVRAAVEAGELPGAAFGVATVADGVVLHEAWGRRGPAGGSVTTATPFSLASTTKPIAGTVLGRLLQDGLLSLDDPIRRWVPELPAALRPGPEPTVRHIASHTAGLGTHYRFFYADERPPVPVAEAVGILARPVLPVGGQWRYSNLGYGVLQLALERAAGEPMDALVERIVFGPLGMRSSGWGGLDGPAGASSRHLTADEAYPGYVTDHPCASEAWSSIDDLLAFGLAHASRSLLSPDRHDLLGTPAAPRQPDGAAYALGWVTREYEGVRVLIHGGRMGGVSAHLAVAPSLGLVVAGVASIETERLGEAAARVLGAAVPGYHAPVPAEPWSVGRPDPALADVWAGSVRFGDDELPFVLDASGERVTASVGGLAAEVAMPHLQSDGLFGHLLVSPPTAFAAEGSICHLDAVVDGDTIAGALVAAQYPGPVHRRQGDAVSGGLLLHRGGAA